MAVTPPPDRDDLKGRVRDHERHVEVGSSGKKPWAKPTIRDYSDFTLVGGGLDPTINEQASHDSYLPMTS